MPTIEKPGTEINCFSEMKDAALYEDLLIRWIKARKSTSSIIDIGPEPDPKNCGFDPNCPQDKWQVDQIRKRIFKEMNRIE